MDTSAFVTSLATSFAIFIVLLFLYSWLSRTSSNFVIYYPLRISRGLGPPEDVKSRSPWAWLREAWQASEKEIIDLAGLDAAVYINFLDAVLQILGYSAFFCVPVLVPLAVTSDNYSTAVRAPTDPAFGGFDKLSMGNIAKNKSRIWAFLIAAYWLSIVTYIVLWQKYKHIINVRDQVLSANARPEQFTVLVQNLPPPTNGTRSEQVDAFFRKLHPDAYEKCLVVTKLHKSSKLWTKLDSLKRKLKHAEAVFGQSKTKDKPEGIRPQHKTGFLGLVGAKVDTIDNSKEKIKDLSVKLQAEQKRTIAEEQEASAFAIFNNRAVAAEVSQSAIATIASKWRTSQAPEPEEIVWGNLSMPYLPQLFRKFGIYFLVFLIIIFYMIPISFVSALTSLDNLEKLVPFIKSIVKIKVLNTVLQAYLPQLALIIFLALLPSLLMFLSKLEGIVSHSHLVRATAGKYFYFNVVNVFLGVTISGTVFNALKKITKQPGQIVSLLDASLPPQASFFITYIALLFFVGYGLELSRLVPLIIFHIKKRFLCKTEEEIRDAWAPGPFNYHTHVPADMLIVTIAACYAVLAPMVLPFAIMYFALGWIIVRNQALKVYIPKYDSGGRMWPHMQARILAALVISQITMLGYFSVKKFVFSFLLFPLPIATLIFAYVCNKLFYTAFRVTPISLVSTDLKDMPSVASLVEAYTPTCLTPEDKFEDAEKFEDARSTATSRTSSGITSPA
ncbi:hypothetical protein O6H91_02G130600 [Diphasiastrum complanatum]|uniref:Uncharacterized protein n=2 Tax=Diphasiastrum complanatum TaxID=34168 RepID=A0ACC2EKW5_DIPCM|nr:hypothetical protein O6H91_02G130600 [Diphasiastrum complanatum]